VGIRRSRGRALIVGVTGVAALATSAFVTVAAHPAGAAPVTVTFTNTGAAQTFTVPAGVTQLAVDAWGAQGGDNAGGDAGKGGRATATLAVTPGEVLQVNVGGRGGDTSTGVAPGGWNGGGSGGNATPMDIFFDASGGGGGGASDVRRRAPASGQYSLRQRLLVAGGGGGAGYSIMGGAPPPPGAGGHGGRPAGGTGQGGGTTEAGTGGGGGTQSTGGAAGANYNMTVPAGEPGALGIGGSSTSGVPEVTYNTTPGGGGGGGYYGGGSGGGAYGGDGGGGGGGGSSTGPAGTTFATGVRSGAGLVTITYQGGGVAKPDGAVRVRKVNQAFVGNNIYNATGANQTVTAARGQGDIFFEARVQNDATFSDTMKVVGTAGTTNFAVKYTVGGTNVTAAVVAGTYVTPALAPGAAVVITIRVTVKASAPAGSSRAFLVSARSAADPTKVDAITAVGKRT
jgi:hypothetical protein